MGDNMKKEDILELFREFNKSSCNVFTLEQDDFKLHLEKPEGERTAVAAAAPSKLYPQMQEEQEVASNNFFVEAPLVASFYCAPAPGEEPYVQVGDRVAEGQILFILEAMKMINEIKSPVAGRVVAIFPQDGELVEFGQRIVEIEVDHV